MLRCFGQKLRALRKRRLSRLVAAAALAAATGTAVAGAQPRAAGTFPGGNGVIAFATWWPQQLGGATDPNDATVELCGVGLDGRSVRLTRSPIGRVFASPAWNAVGTLLAAESYAAQVGGGVGFVSIGGTPAPGASFDSAEHPTWSPDGTEVAYAAPSMSGSSRELFVSPVGSAAPRVVLSEPASVSDSAPAWSPDGNWIAFSSNRDGTPSGLYLVHPDGTGVHRLTTGLDAAYQPAWSPDGSTILYVSQASGSSPSMLATVPAAGGPSHSLGLAASSGTFSPDGRLIGFASPDGRVEVANADGTAVRVLYPVSETGTIDWQPLPAGAAVPSARPPCVLYGTAGGDRIAGSRFADVILAGAGNDVVDAGAGNDLVSGGPGNDRLAGGTGADDLDGGPGADRLTGGPGGDVLEGGARKRHDPRARRNPRPGLLRRRPRYRLRRPARPRRARLRAGAAPLAQVASQDGTEPQEQPWVSPRGRRGV